MEDWLKDVEISMLPNGLCQMIAEEIGVENLLKLARITGGNTFYIPKEKQILRPLRDKKILAEYNRYNTAELSRKYGVSGRWVRELVKANNPKSKMKGSM